MEHRCPRHQLQPVARGDALLPAQRTEPPSFETTGFLLNDSDNVTFLESKFIWRLCNVVILSPCYQSLLKIDNERYMFKKVSTRC